jgi:transposase
MWVRVKKAVYGGNPREYLQIVESYRDEHGKSRQRIVGSLGRLDQLRGKKLDNLIRKLAAFSDRLEVLDTYRAEKELHGEKSREWGRPLVFQRLWERCGFPDIISRIIKAAGPEERYGFDVERAVFAQVLQRICSPGSDLKGSRWLKRTYAEGFDALHRDPLYWALDFLALHQEDIERELFFRNRTLFDNDLDLVFFDTTSLYFEGNGPNSLAKRGKSKDHRPQNTQVVVGIVLTREGRPIFCKVWPGNTADVTTLIPVIDELKARFGVKRVIVVCDRGMISKKNLMHIRRRRLHYIIGVKLRKSKEVQEKVLTRAGRYQEVAENLKVKEVWVGRSETRKGRRYIVCCNPEEAERDKRVREDVLSHLRKALSSGKRRELIKNRAYKRYLKIDRDAFDVDEKKIREDSKLDGKWVLRTSTALPAETVALAYKSLWMIEAAIRVGKNLLEVRPLFHRLEHRIKGHVFAAFLALYLVTELKRTLHAQDVKAPWDAIMQALSQVHAVLLSVKGKPYLLRTDIPRNAYCVLRAVGLRPPSPVTPL